jgi:hypothetical protein
MTPSEGLQLSTESTTLGQRKLMARLLAATLVATALVLVASACGAAERHSSADDGRLSVSLKQVPLANYGLGPNDCFVATSRAEVRLAARSPQRAGLCRKLAKRYFPPTAGRVWKPIRHESDAPTLICLMARPDALVEVLSASYDSGRVDADGICQRLSRNHWESRPLIEAP